MSPSRARSDAKTKTAPSSAKAGSKSSAKTTVKRSAAAAAGMGFPEPESMALDSVIPYWRNPRRINDDAVNALVKSITEYGYSQPIVVDEQRTIIIGHTRYTALRRMGVTSAPVIVARGLTPIQVKELRVLDNKSAEYTSWDFEALSEELQDLNLTLMRAFFPEVGSIRDDGPQDLETGADTEPDTSAWDDVDSLAEFICPACFHTFEINVTVKAVKSGKLQVSA